MKAGVRPFEFYIQLTGDKKKHVFGPSDAKQRDLWKQAFKQASKLDRDSDDEKEDSQDDYAQHWALKRTDSGPRPLIGNNWRTELVAYALEIFFLCILKRMVLLK